MAVSRSVAWLATDRLAEKVVSICSTRRSKATCCSAAMAIAFSVVKSYCGSTAVRAAACASAVWTVALEVDRPRREDVARREVADRDLERLLREDVGAEDGGERDDQDRRRDRQA